MENSSQSHLRSVVKIHEMTILINALLFANCSLVRTFDKLSKERSKKKSPFAGPSDPYCALVHLGPFGQREQHLSGFEKCR